MTVITFPRVPKATIAKVSQDWGLAHPLSFAVEIMLEAEGDATELKRCWYVLHDTLRAVRNGQRLATCSNPPNNLEAETVAHIYRLGPALSRAIVTLKSVADADRVSAEDKIKTVMQAVSREIERLDGGI